MQRRQFLQRTTALAALELLAPAAWAASLRNEKPAAGDILIGQVAPFSGIQAHYGQSLAAGMRAAFAQANLAGGIHGRQIKLLTADDQFDPDKTLAGYDSLAEQGVIAFCSNFGTPTTLKALPWIAQHGIPLIGVYSGAQQIRAPTNPMIFNLRGSLLDEARSVAGMLSQIGATPGAIVYENDAYGQAGLSALLAQSMRFDLQAGLSADASKGDAAAVARRIVASKVKSVVLVLTTRAASYVIESLRTLGYGRDMEQIVALSGVGPFALSRALASSPASDSTSTVIVSTVTPYPFGGGAQGPLTAVFREQMAGNGAAHLVNFSSMEGYINAMVLLRALGQSKTMDSSGVVSSMNAMGRMFIGEMPGGFSLNITPNDHLGTHYTNLVRLHRDGTYSNS